jgi:branched-chain amino acid transport system ATP-binding protein
VVEEVFDLLDELDDRRDAKVEDLSGGQAKMVAIGRALALRPDLLILDEPLEGLAPVVVEKLKGYIRDINDRGIAVLVAESNVTHVPEVVDRLAVIERGEIVARGDPDEVVQDEEIERLMQGSGVE